LDLSAQKFVPASEHSRLRTPLRKDTIIFCRKNSDEVIGSSAIVAEDAPQLFLSDLLWEIEANPGVYVPWMLELLQSVNVRQEIKLRATGTQSSMKNISQGRLLDISILIPPCAEQRQIARILFTWDESLSRERSLSAHLSSLYRGLADRFLQVRGDSMHQLGSLLTPEKMAAVTPDGPFRALGVRSHGKGTFSRIDSLAAVEEFGKTVYRVEPNLFIVNIVFAWEGAAAITSEADSGCLVLHRFPTFRINDQLLDIEYFRHVIRTKPFRQLLALASPGGAGRNKTLNRDDLLKFKIHVPPLSEQGEIAETLNSLDRRISLLDDHTSRLARQRDALATQLLTGRLRVKPDAERT
jgi:type I restriction enzyme S subunit